LRGRYHGRKIGTRESLGQKGGNGIHPAVAKQGVGLEAHYLFAVSCQTHRIILRHHYQGGTPGQWYHFFSLGLYPCLSRSSQQAHARVFKYLAILIGKQRQWFPVWSASHTAFPFLHQ
jgi:hypothetical protein